jgi:hypothetical protein
MNKKVLKYSYILGFIISAIECTTITLIPVGIVGFIASFKIKKYYRVKVEKFDKYSDKFLTWSIVLSLSTVIPGIICLIYYIVYGNMKLKELDKK